MTTPSLPEGASFLLDDPAAIFRPEDFSSDERMMVQTAERFCRERVLPNLERIEKQEDGLMPDLIREAGELGLCGVDSPEEYGGLGMGKNLAARILEFMSLDGSFSVTYGITSGISQVGLSLFGTEAQKAAYLPALTSGEMMGAYALSEPNSGSDALSATTRADRVDGGYRLNGTKMWISNAKWAGQFLTMAKVDGERFSAFLVERDRPGVLDLARGAQDGPQGLLHRPPRARGRPDPRREPALRRGQGPPGRLQRPQPGPLQARLHVHRTRPPGDRACRDLRAGAKAVRPPHRRFRPHPGNARPRRRPLLRGRVP